MSVEGRSYPRLHSAGGVNLHERSNFNQNNNHNNPYHNPYSNHQQQNVNQQQQYSSQPPSPHPPAPSASSSSSSYPLSPLPSSISHDSQAAISALQQYRVVRTIGRGKFGVCQLVESSVTNKLYVLKCISLHDQSPRERELSLLEVETLQRLQLPTPHPFIVKYYQSYLVQDALYILMSYCGGGDLHQFLRHRKQSSNNNNNHSSGDGSQQSPQQELNYLEENVIVDWLIQLLLAIRKCHDMHIIHRDIKSSNIFLVPTKFNELVQQDPINQQAENSHAQQQQPVSYICKLGDFGISRVLNSTNDLAMSVVGTPYSMSPEVCENKPYSFSSDIWALGCVLYEMCTLRHAFDSNNLLGLVWKIVSENYPPIPSIYSHDLSELVSAMLAKDPHARPTIDQILDLKFIRHRLRAQIGEKLRQRSVTHAIENNLPIPEAEPVEESESHNVFDNGLSDSEEGEEYQEGEEGPEGEEDEPQQEEHPHRHHSTPTQTASSINSMHANAGDSHSRSLPPLDPHHHDGDSSLHGSSSPQSSSHRHSHHHHHHHHARAHDAPTISVSTPSNNNTPVQGHRSASVSKSTTPQQDHLTVHRSSAGGGHGQYHDAAASSSAAATHEESPTSQHAHSHSHHSRQDNPARHSNSELESSGFLRDLQKELQANSKSSGSLSRKNSKQQSQSHQRDDSNEYHYNKQNSSPQNSTGSGSLSSAVNSTSAKRAGGGGSINHRDSDASGIHSDSNKRSGSGMGTHHRLHSSDVDAGVSSGSSKRAAVLLDTDVAILLASGSNSSAKSPNMFGQEVAMGLKAPNNYVGGGSSSSSISSAVHPHPPPQQPDSANRRSSEAPRASQSLQLQRPRSQTTSTSSQSSSSSSSSSSSLKVKVSETLSPSAPRLNLFSPPSTNQSTNSNDDNIAREGSVSLYEVSSPRTPGAFAAMSSAASSSSSGKRAPLLASGSQAKNRLMAGPQRLSKIDSFSEAESNTGGQQTSSGGKGNTEKWATTSSSSQGYKHSAARASGLSSSGGKAESTHQTLARTGSMSHSSHNTDKSGKGGKSHKSTGVGGGDPDEEFDLNEAMMHRHIPESDGPDGLGISDPEDDSGGEDDNEDDLVIEQLQSELRSSLANVTAGGERIGRRGSLDAEDVEEEEDEDEDEEEEGSNSSSSGGSSSSGDSSSSDSEDEVPQRGRHPSSAGSSKKGFSVDSTPSSQPRRVKVIAASNGVRIAPATSSTASSSSTAHRANNTQPQRSASTITTSSSAAAAAANTATTKPRALSSHESHGAHTKQSSHLSVSTSAAAIARRVSPLSPGSNFSAPVVPPSLVAKYNAVKDSCLRHVSENDFELIFNYFQSASDATQFVSPRGVGTAQFSRSKSHVSSSASESPATVEIESPLVKTVRMQLRKDGNTAAAAIAPDLMFKVQQLAELHTLIGMQQRGEE